MTRKRKTPPEIRTLIANHLEYMNYIQEVLDSKQSLPLENQANHIKSKSVDYWIGLAHGASTGLENVLHVFNCYAGFQYVGKRVGNDIENYNPFIGSDLEKHPEFVSWRVKYMTRD